jgi:hypothetical protein
VGAYSLVQFSPDPGRQERLNVGIVVTGPEGITVRFSDRDDVDGGASHRFEELLRHLSSTVPQSESDDWLAELASRRFSSFVITQPSHFDDTQVSADDLLRRLVAMRQPA